MIKLIEVSDGDTVTIPSPLPAVAAPGVKTMFLTHTGQIGGAEVCLLNVVNGFDSSVFLFKDGPLRQRLRDLGVHVELPRRQLDLQAVRRDRGILNALPVTGGIVALLGEIRRKAARYDLIYCNSQKSFVLGAIATTLQQRPLLWHLHDILDEAHFGHYQLRLVIRLANWRASQVVAPSRAVAEAFVAVGGRADLVKIVANGVKVSTHETGPNSRALLRRQMGLPDGTLFGVFSRLSPWKGQHVALEALALLPGAACIIVGEALFGERDYVAGLRQQVERLGLLGRVHFLGHRDDVALLMRAVDVVVHPSIEPEPFGLTLVEAMFARTPVLASNTGAALDILDSGRFGTLVPPGDVAALAAALSRLLDNNAPEVSTTQRQVVEARRHAETHYTADRMVRDIRRLASKLVHGPDRGHDLVQELEGRS
ncbi:glycosyltransferase [Lichenicoccus roseus]|uniref:Glycosyltransferase n=1 Tax=Lichenicoccus roseus TaxID=2683649 RepID=A0A5R9J7P6_9PROT|nr:glycosyltransferase [Lichenicoccus roseus]TLU72537.1 glycosyltransferase [Lichenicoccus roseus]